MRPAPAAQAWGAVASLDADHAEILVAVQQLVEMGVAPAIVAAFQRTRRRSVERKKPPEVVT